VINLILSVGSVLVVCCYPNRYVPLSSWSVISLLIVCWSPLRKLSRYKYKCIVLYCIVNYRGAKINVNYDMSLSQKKKGDAQRGFDYESRSLPKLGARSVTFGDIEFIRLFAARLNQEQQSKSVTDSLSRWPTPSN
jgi:hypothetical protein